MPPSVTVAASAFNTTTSPKSVTNGWSTGDLVLVMGMAADDRPTQSFNAPTGTGLDFSAGAIDVDSGTSQTHCRGGSWSCVATGGGSDVSLSMSGISNLAQWGFMTVVATAASNGGIGVHGLPAPSTALTTAINPAAHSCVCELIGDWGAVSLSGHSETPASFSEEVAGQSSGEYSWYGITWRDSSAGSQQYGISGITPTQVLTKLYVEILAGGAAPQDATVTLLPAQANVTIHP